MATAIRILVMEGALDDPGPLAAALQASGWDTDWGRTGPGEALEAALADPWDLVLCGLTGAQETMDRVQARVSWLPILVLYGPGEEEAALALLTQGAADALGRDEAARLPVAVGRLLRESQAVAARFRAEAQVRRLSRMYRLLSEINQAIVRISDPSELLADVCRLSVRWGSYSWVRVVQGDPWEVVAGAGRGEAPPLWWEHQCLAEAKTLVPLVPTDGPGPALAPWGGAAVFPLRLGSDVWGCLAFYSEFDNVFVPEETALLQELADDLGFGLMARTQDHLRRESERALQDMAALLPGLFFKVTRSRAGGTKFLYCSPGIDLLLPLSPQRVLADASAVFRAVHPEDAPLLTRAVLQSMRTLTVFSLEFRIVRPHGAVVWVLATAFPQRQRDGTFVWTGMAIDINPQHRLQQALRREQELLQVILDHIGDGVVAIDGAGHLNLVNRTAARWLDRDPGAVAGPWSRLAPDLPWDAVEAFRPWYRHRADGSVQHLEALASQLPSLGSGGPGRVLLLRDVTERDRIEERLRQSEKLESIGLVASGIAHDFNNLLTGIFGYVQLAQLCAEDPAQVRSHLDQALGPFRRARTLTEQLLTFARGGAPTTASLGVRAVLDHLLPFTYEGSAVQWMLTADPDLWPVEANEAQLHQVFDNLLLNARQSGAHRVTVELSNVAPPGPPHRGLPPGAYVQAVVRDDGPGMTSETAARIFDPFFTTKAHGTGLGLSICFSVLKKHGGAIEVDSSPGRGATFRVFWPAVQG